MVGILVKWGELFEFSLAERRITLAVSPIEIAATVSSFALIAIHQPIWSNVAIDMS